MKLSCFACENYIFIKTFMGKNILIGNGKKEERENGLPK